MDVDHLGIRHVLTLWDSFIVLAAYQMGLALFLATYLDSWNLGFSNPWDRLISRVEPPSSSSSSSQRRHPWHRATCFPMVHVAEKKKGKWRSRDPNSLSHDLWLRCLENVLCGQMVEIPVCLPSNWWNGLVYSCIWKCVSFQKDNGSETYVGPFFFLFFFPSPIVLRRNPLKTVFLKVGPLGASAPWVRHDPKITGVVTKNNSNQW